VKLFIIMAVALFAAFTIACSGDQPANVAVNVNKANVSTPAMSPLPSATIDELASGRKIYSVSCQNCHKENGKGGPTEIEGKKIEPEDLTSAKIKGFSDEKILGYIMNGVEDEGMPAFKGRLSEAEMRDVLKFIRVELQGMPADAALPKR
jgi:mono/diheme cytochrome c family protein